MSAWPFFDLAVRTPRLVLRYADDELLAALTAFRTDRPFPPGAEPFDGDSSFYDDPPEAEWKSLRGEWGAGRRPRPTGGTCRSPRSSTARSSASRTSPASTS